MSIRLASWSISSCFKLPKKLGHLTWRENVRYSGSSTAWVSYQKWSRWNRGTFSKILPAIIILSEIDQQEIKFKPSKSRVMPTNRLSCSSLFDILIFYLTQTISCSIQKKLYYGKFMKNEISPDYTFWPKSLPIKTRTISRGHVMSDIV